MTPPSAVTSFFIQIGSQQPLLFLLSLIESETGQTLGVCLSILMNHPLSVRRDPLENPPMHFLRLLEEVQSLKHSSLTINHILSWSKHCN